MGARVTGWIVTLLLGATGFAVSYGTAGSTPRVASPRPDEAPAPREYEPVSAPTPAPALASRPTTSAPAPLDGVELIRQVLDAYPERGRHTFAETQLSVMRLVEDYVRDHGGPSAACATDGSLDDAILTVQWRVSTDSAGTHIRGGALAIDQFAEPAHACLQDYLAKIEGDFPTPLPLVELDVLYQWPIPARVVLANPTTSADAGVAPAGG